MFRLLNTKYNQNFNSVRVKYTTYQKMKKIIKFACDADLQMTQFYNKRNRINENWAIFKFLVLSFHLLTIVANTLKQFDIIMAFLDHTVYLSISNQSLDDEYFVFKEHCIYTVDIFSGSINIEILKNKKDQI